MKSAITLSLVKEARGGPFVLWDGLERSMEVAAEIGFDAVEIFAPSTEAVDLETVQVILRRTGLSVCALGTGAGWVKHRLQLADPDAEKRRQARQFVREIIDHAGALGAMAIIGSMQGPSGHTGDAETARGYLADALEECGSHAQQYGVPLIYEPLNRYETRQCVTMAEGVQLLESLSTKNVKLLADLFHMNIEETDLPAAIRHAGEHIGHVHFVDSNRRPVGSGHLDYAPIFDAFHAIGYAGFLCAEAFPYPDPHEAARQTLRAYRYWTGAKR
ncbi:MAG: sugar phosphate isomerase/epimerase family protein [Planctomycetota bacterium]